VPLLSADLPLGNSKTAAWFLEIIPNAGGHITSGMLKDVEGENQEDHTAKSM